MPRGKRQRQQPLAHDRQHGLALRHLVARMQRRELDRNARIGADIRAVAAAVQRRDGIGIGAQVAQRIGFRARRLAQHVVGIEIALRGHIAAAAHRLVDGAAKHELLAHLAHRRRHSATDNRLAQAPHHRAQRADDSVIGVVQHAAGQHQRPGRCVDEDRADSPECADQSCGAILSWIRSSMVCGSGTRSSASARHISATPSLVERP